MPTGSSPNEKNGTQPTVSPPLALVFWLTIQLPVSISLPSFQQLLLPLSAILYTTDPLWLQQLTLVCHAFLLLFHQGSLLQLLSLLFLLDLFPFLTQKSIFPTNWQLTLASHLFLLSFHHWSLHLLLLHLLFPLLPFPCLSPMS